MPLERQLTAGNPKDDMSPSRAEDRYPKFQEHDVIRVAKTVVVDGIRIPEGTAGTIISIYECGQVFAVEVSQITGEIIVLTLNIPQIVKSAPTARHHD